MTSAIDYDALDPGIRDLVRELVAHGFRTTDSGDGRSKPGDERALDVPHVFMTCEPHMLIAESHRLLALVEVRFPDAVVEASYSPSDRVGVLSVMLIVEAP